MRFEPLGDRERASFSCGIPELDSYFVERASQDVKRKVAAPFVMLDGDGRIPGYYTLSAYTIRVGELPREIAKKLPRYPLVPATLLGRLAVSQADRGRKLGTLLLMDALFRCLSSTTQVASVGVVAEAIDEKAVRFYEHHEFIPLVDQPRKLFIAMATIQRAFA